MIFRKVNALQEAFRHFHLYLLLPLLMLSVIMRLAVIIINIIFIFNSIFIIALAANLNVIVS